MNRPYVICHMVTSLDGKIDGTWFQVPEAKPVFEAGKFIRQNMNYQAVLYGTTTMAQGFSEGYAGELPHSEEIYPKEDYIADATFGNYIVSLDTEGVLGWNGGYPSKKGRAPAHIIEVLTEVVSNDYLAYLRSNGISYVFAGKETLDCGVLLEKLKRYFSIERLLIAGGGITNWTFAKDGYVDELSIMMIPFADGDSKNASLFEDPTNAGRCISFDLKHVQALDGGGVWLSYTKREKAMIYKDFQGVKLSNLGFGTMRLPTLADGSIDQEQVEVMTAYAIDHGINYFDTAYPYHGGQSEIAIGKALRKYPRSSYYLATKYPGHQISKSYDPKAIFEDQLKKCGVDYFDFYLLHNVYENSINTYLDSRWGIVEYFLEQKKLGRIKHLGFSCHGRPETLKRFLDAVGEHMEFCQIQLNYLDWTLQDAKSKVELLNQYNIPIWVMEPVRGGRLAKLDEASEEKLKAMRPDESIPAWGFRFLQSIPGVTMVLSGMSNLEQMEDNVKTFSAVKPLSEEETETLLAIAEGMKDSIPCTACRYCTKECPMGLDIPMLIASYNELRFAAATNVSMRLECLPEDKQPSACLACGKCAKMCPQMIDIPKVMKELSEKLATMPKWADICRQRDEAAAKLQQK